MIEQTRLVRFTEAAPHPSDEPEMSPVVESYEQGAEVLSASLRRSESTDDGIDLPSGFDLDPRGTPPFDINTVDPLTYYAFSTAILR